MGEVLNAGRVFPQRTHLDLLKFVQDAEDNLCLDPQCGVPLPLQYFLYLPNYHSPSSFGLQQMPGSHGSSIGCWIQSPFYLRFKRKTQPSHLLFQAHTLLINRVHVHGTSTEIFREDGTMPQSQEFVLLPVPARINQR